nr:S-layer homology domain-containing protein [uncultured Butyricicoccus sp.]
MRKARLSRIGKLLLAFVMLLNVCVIGPVTPVETAAAHWADSSLTKLRDWGVMRGDQNGSMEPDRNITRAEFVTMINRAFGYKTMGKQPFRDVKGTEWYANDINIAYNQGYFVGSSKNTASPNDSLTREEAMTLIGRNLMLTPDESENMIFTDGRALSSWSRGIVTAAAKKGIVKGDSEGTFRPQAPITRGEVATLLARTIGTPLNQAGSSTLGMVRGNVMISASGVELHDTTINGDLYITAGVGLGYVTLNNVTVNGQVIASGSGVSNASTNSLTARNCLINELIVDSPNNVAISFTAEGSTRIEKTYVRTDSFLEEQCYGSNGFQSIEVDGEQGTRLDLSGDFKDVTIKTAEGVVALGRGSIEKLMVDESATDASVIIDEGALINEVYLDAPTNITGAGDIGYLKVNTNGSTIQMLPDKIEIRPGVIANINGEDMTSQDAEESSSYPRILAGYPKLDDVGPTAANAILNTNKTGTVYWGVTLEADGPLSSDQLIKPPSYGFKAVVSGQSPIETAEEDITTAIRSLKTDTEYTFSAALVDERGDRSPRKTRDFITPDNTIPAFAAGYPRLDHDDYTDESRTDYFAAIESVATKTCTVYYAVYKQGLPAPTADELRTQTMSGHIKGTNGKMNVQKNEPHFITVNGLAEKTSYDMYFVLSDGVNMSGVKKLSFTTGDRTPPEFNEDYPKSDNAKEKSVDVKYSVNEDATVYWVAVKRGDTYPVPPDNWEGGSVPLDSDEAKAQVMSGSNALKSGKASAKMDKEGKFTISGLEAQTGYDVYLVLQDTAGNIGKQVVTLQVKTLDVIPPVAELAFYPDVNGEPLVESDISIVFNEEIRVEVSENGKRLSLHELQGEELLNAVKRNFTFYDLEYDTLEQILDNSSYTTENVICVLEEGKTILTFKDGALPLVAGNKYKVVLDSNIYDTSNNKLDAKSRELEFTTVFSRIIQTELDETPDVPIGDASGGTKTADLAFELRPQSTRVSEKVMFDLIFWSDSNIEFELYQQQEDGSWQPVKTNADPAEPVVGIIDENGAVSLRYLTHGTSPETFEKLVDFKEARSYAIKVTKLDGKPADQGNKIVNIYSVPVASGNLSKFQQLANNPKGTWDKLVENGDVTLIGTPPSLEMFVILSDTTIPKFVSPYPNFDYIGDSIVIPKVQVDRTATLYYVVAPAGSIQVRDDKGQQIITPPKDGDLKNPQNQQPNLSTPIPQDIANQIYNGISGAIQGKFAGTDEKGILPNTVSEFEIKGLKPLTKYDVFFVLKGAAPGYSPVYYYQITTKDVITPTLKLENSVASVGNNQITVKTSEQSHVWWKLYQTNLLPPQITDNILPAGECSKEFKLEDNSPLAQIGNLIKGGDGSGDNAKESGELDITGVPLPPDNMLPATVQLHDLKQKQPYTMVALAQNRLGGNYVLYRLDKIIAMDGTPPTIVNVLGGVTEVVPGKYNGTITVTFSEPLYYKFYDSIDERYPLGDKEVQISGTGAHMIWNNMGKATFVSGSSAAEGTGDKKAYTSIAYTFVRCQINSALSFPYQIVDKDGNPVDGSGQFTLTLEEGVKDDGKKAGFVATLGSQRVLSYTP